MRTSITANDLRGVDVDLRQFLERLPGRLPQKQEFFTGRFHLHVPKTSYDAMWRALAVAGDVPRAKYIFDYARLHLSDRLRALLAEAARGAARRSAGDPALADLLLYRNGKPRRLGRLLIEYLPTDDGKTLVARPPPSKRAPAATSAPTLVAAPHPTANQKRHATSATVAATAAARPAAVPPPATQKHAATATTRTRDPEPAGRWQDQSQYETVRRLGKGGMGFVYLVRDRASGRELAAKVIDPKHRKDEEYQARFFREVRAQSLLRHQNILRIQHHGRDFYICEVCDGSLSDLLSGKPLARPQALGFFADACAGIQAAHSGGVLHRDIKPSNLLRRTRGGLVVADFGLCKIDSSDFTTMTSTNMGGGTLRYAAPEQWRNMKSVDVRADVYSLGVVLQDLLLGSASATPGDPDSLHRYADPFAAAIEKATALHPEQRFPTVRAFAREIARAAGRAASTNVRGRR